MLNYFKTRATAATNFVKKHPYLTTASLAALLVPTAFLAIYFGILGSLSTALATASLYFAGYVFGSTLVLVGIELYRFFNFSKNETQNNNSKMGSNAAEALDKSPAPNDEVNKSKSTSPVENNSVNLAAPVVADTANDAAPVVVAANDATIGAAPVVADTANDAAPVVVAANDATIEAAPVVTDTANDAAPVVTVVTSNSGRKSPKFFDSAAAERIAAQTKEARLELPKHGINDPALGSQEEHHASSAASSKN